VGTHDEGSGFLSQVLLLKKFVAFYNLCCSSCTR